MVSLEWDKLGTRIYEYGIDRVVFYPLDGFGVIWNGVTSIDESVIGGDIVPLISDDTIYLNFSESREFQATITAFSHPREFFECDGVVELQRGLFVTQQPRKMFGLSYRTLISNENEDLGYKLHLAYNLMATPSARNNQTTSNQVNPLSLRWTLDSVPPQNTLKQPTARLVIDSRKYSSSKIIQIENLLYGTISTNPTLPTQSTIATILGGP